MMCVREKTQYFLLIFVCFTIMVFFYKSKMDIFISIFQQNMQMQMIVVSINSIFIISDESIRKPIVSADIELMVTFRRIKFCQDLFIRCQIYCQIIR